MSDVTANEVKESLRDILAEAKYENILDEPNHEIEDYLRRVKFEGRNIEPGSLVPHIQAYKDSI